MVVAWHERVMACVNQTRPNCINQMGKTQSKPLAARYGRETVWARHGMCELAFTVLPSNDGYVKASHCYVYTYIDFKVMVVVPRYRGPVQTRLKEQRQENQQ
jgi:hypothetical protein